jgi:nicotinamidase/pyrazinamidase
MKALIIVDVQNDFMPNGPLAVPEGDLIVPVINALQPRFDLVVATQDWHPRNHKSFASNHQGRSPFETIDLNGLPQTLWPDHCVQESAGAELHPGLGTAAIEAIFRKGMDPEIDSYGGFYDNGHRKSTGLAGYLREKGASDLYFCGLAAEICVYSTLNDALRLGFAATLIEGATRPLNKADFDEARKRIIRDGGKISTAHEIA